TTICAGDTLLLDATLNGASYLWHDNSINPTFEVTEAGVYYVERTNNSGCVVADTIIVMVDASDSRIDELGTTTSLTVYPNPVVNTLNIDMPLTKERIFKLEIYNIDGKLVLSNLAEIDNTNHISINVENLKSGIYTLHLSNSKEQFNAKWI